MRTEIQDMKFDAWRHGLLDISRRNRLMNYRKSIRATLQVVSPTLFDLYRRLVINGERLSFRKQIDVGDDPNLVRLFYIMDRMGASVELAEGEVRSDLSAAEMNLTLKNLRAKAKLSQEEQGINILYLCFGFLQWRQKPSDPYMLSPLVLVPISLEIGSILSPYCMKRLEEDIVVNPTLDYALSSEYGIALPDFDPLTVDIAAFLDEVNAAVTKKGWSVVREANIGLLSFLKIVMYKDLEKYRDRIFSNPVVRAFCGDSGTLGTIDESLRQFPHDRTPAIDNCQVVNADASQQDAILLSRKGASFVLQGPPGTGKSQTITNIIAQALADRKKVLFVSEKMAALSVVYRRLESVGLADYCLSLHNYRAERRAVIQDLVKTLDAPTRSVKPGVTDALAVLEEERSRLNAYVEEMNKPRAPLNRTIFEVVTELVSLEKLGFFRVAEETIHTTQKDFAARVSALKRLADFLEHCEGDIHDNPWQGSEIPMITYDVRNEIVNGLGTLAGALFGVSGSLSYLGQKYGAGRPWCLNEFERLTQHMICAMLLERAAAALDTGRGSALFEPASLDALEDAYNELTDAHCRALSLGLSDNALTDAAAMEREGARLAGERDRFVYGAGMIEALRRATSVVLPSSDSGLIQAKALLLALNIRRAVPTAWFREDRIQTIRRDVRLWRELADKVKLLGRAIDANWEREFYSFDCDALLSRFERDYATLFKHLNPQYRSDRSGLIAARRGRPPRLDDGECMAGLRLLKAYREALGQFNAAAETAGDVLGSQFRGIDTDWDGLVQVLDDCEPAETYFQKYGLSDVLLILLEKPWHERVQAILSQLDASSMERAIGEIEMAIGNVTEDARPYSERIDSIDEARAALDACAKACAAARRVAADFQAHGMTTPEAIDPLLVCLASLIRVIREASSQRDAVGEYFDGVGWPLTREFLGELQEVYGEYCDEGAISAEVDALRARYAALDAEAFRELPNAAANCRHRPEAYKILGSFAKWFPRQDLGAMPIQALSERVNRCRDIESLQSWMQYVEVARACRQHGMEEYLEYLESARVAPDDIIPLYRKAFLTKWLMEILVTEDISCLRNFQSYAHEKAISDFSTSDANQLQIAQVRLVDWLSHEKPSGIMQLASAMDEATILRREAEKKRRIVPLRRLFKMIPTLLQRLKPCFMMSPLSVSYFLDSDMYSFDMVIFDEASQILPEDAIGAIYRGKQVIIAGDTRQMPPTNFFSVVSKNMDDYDVDEDSDEYYPDVVSESVLDEAAACLPSCMLLWHYRSKDESLIAFSNRELYNNSLITFPNCSHLEDRGLEYVYVPNGCYEGSGRNCNVMEARKCLALVIEHIQKHPERSLGIIAFSEKQQGVIEDIISDFRLKNPQYEDFFDETRDEPFFVKNLENVQGDERDTIIFSICYAKNAQGRMYQRFGPLSHDGGERRLNVAITRAKYNVKLVGSIMPTDILVKEGTREGVRLLREYIYYAMQNDYGVPQGDPQAADEPFADQIAAFLEANGYACKRNVGASAYKVDIAVEKPGCPQMLMAGIECDGKNYANTRTARDRDVLRRDIMASLGWRLYHVWALAWFMNPDQEKKGLLDFLRQCDALAIGEPLALPGSDARDDGGGTSVAPVAADQMMDVEDRSADTITIAFETYEYSNPMEAQCEPGQDDYTVLSSRILWVMEREQPIHREELYRRLAVVFGNTKATPSARRMIDDCIDRRLSGKVVERGDFFYLDGAPVFARAPRQGDEPRSIDHIAPEEIQDAIRRILSFARALTARDLVSETARQLGYARTGPRINAVLEENWQAMLCEGRIRGSDGKLYCVEGND